MLPLTEEISSASCIHVYACTAQDSKADSTYTLGQQNPDLKFAEKRNRLKDSCKGILVESLQKERLIGIINDPGHG